MASCVPRGYVPCPHTKLIIVIHTKLNRKNDNECNTNFGIDKVTTIEQCFGIGLLHLLSNKFDSQGWFLQKTET